MNRVSTEEVLNKAYRLAYFLHQDKGMASRIVAAATLKLNVAMAVQSKRLYYVPVGRFSRGESRRTDGIRNKTLFSDLHLLQRLVYVESEPYERQKERAAQVTPPGVHAVGDPATEEDLLVYFIKHLVRITTKRNAFYVTLGVSRLLHSYSTLETMEIYNAVIGEPERVKDDYYYRSRKAVLMQEMFQRFGQLIRACRHRRGEERFETRQSSSEQRSLVKECLRLFTPWDTQCPVPHDFDPLKSVIAALTSKSSAEENRIEIKRIHAVLHPDCFARLVAAFRYGAPEERIELPRFFSDQPDDQSPPRQRSAPADLSAEELAEINDMLAEEAGRRRRSPSAVMRIIVDGVERGRLNPNEQSSISFRAEADAELIEVKTTDPDGDLLLATYLLTSFANDTHATPVVASIRLESGQYLSLSITRTKIQDDGDAGLMVQFGYRETNPLRAVRLWWQRLDLNWRGGDVRISARHIVFASVIIAVTLLTSYLGYVKLRSRETTGPQLSSVQPTPLREAPSSVASPGAEVINPAGTPSRTEAPIPPSKQTDEPDNATATTTDSNRSAPQRPQQARRYRSNTAKPDSSPGAGGASEVRDDDNATDVTRSGRVVANLTLKDVKKVYVEMRGSAAFDELRGNLVASLSSSGVVGATTDAGEADAALKISVLQSDTGGGPQISVQLVNARGTVLWPKTGRGARRYSGATNKVVSEIVSDLLSEIRSARSGGN